MFVQSLSLFSTTPPILLQLIAFDDQHDCKYLEVFEVLSKLSLSVPQVQTTTMCISVSLSGFVVLGCMFAPKVHIIMFQPQKNVTSHRLNLNRFSVSGPPATYVSHGEEPSKTSIAVREHGLLELA